MVHNTHTLVCSFCRTRSRLRHTHVVACVDAVVDYRASIKLTKHKAKAATEVNNTPSTDDDLRSSLAPKAKPKAATIATEVNYTLWRKAFV